jgi:hypothetical protein
MKDSDSKSSVAEPGILPISFQKFCSSIPITPMTGWRWRQRGWIETINLAGRLYCTPEAIAKFNRRSATGEFSKEHKVPRRVASALP